MIQKCKLLLTSSLLAGPRTSRKSLTPLSILATQRDPHHQGWSSPARWSTHHSSCWKGESPTPTASIPSRNNEVTVAHTIAPMADVYHRYLHAIRNWSPGSWWLLLEDDLHLTSSTGPEQCQQGHFTAKRDVFKAWHPQSPSLWHWPTICKCPVCQLLYIVGHITQNLKSALPTIQWICQGMHQVHQTCTSMSQIQWCQSTSCLTSTPSYTHWHQASISTRALQPRYATATHQPYTSMNRLTHTLMLLNHRLTNAAQHLCHWTTSCNIWHPPKDLSSCYCDMHPTMEKLLSMHQQWIQILPHMETPLWMQCQDTVPSGTTATMQAPTRHHFSVSQPASPPPAPHMQPTTIAPATLATQMNQAPTVPATPAVQKNAPAPMHVTSHATPVQPQRSSHASMAPRCLIQEI